MQVLQRLIESDNVLTAMRGVFFAHVGLQTVPCTYVKSLKGHSAKSQQTSHGFALQTYGQTGKRMTHILAASHLAECH